MIQQVTRVGTTLPHALGHEGLLSFWRNIGEVVHHGVGHVAPLPMLCLQCARGLPSALLPWIGEYSVQSLARCERHAGLHPPWLLSWGCSPLAPPERFRLITCNRCCNDHFYGMNLTGIGIGLGFDWAEFPSRSLTDPGSCRYSHQIVLTVRRLSFWL